MTTYLERIEAVLPLLTGRGFTVLSIDESPAVFGNTCVILGSRDIAVRFIFDRGQFFADVGAPGKRQRWYALEDILSLIPASGDCTTPKGSTDAILVNERAISSLVESPRQLDDAGLSARK